MKRFAVPGVICMALLFAAMLPALAQDDHQDDRNSDARPQEQHDQQSHDQNQAKQDQDKRDQNKQVQEKAAQDRQDQDKHDQAARDEHASTGRRIDDAHYREHFGSNHHFAVHHIQRVDGRDRFAYGGYNFELVQPWPAGWSYNDNCYIEFVDGQYFLYDLNHPGITIALIVL